MLKEFCSRTKNIRKLFQLSKLAAVHFEDTHSQVQNEWRSIKLYPRPKLYMSWGRISFSGGCNYKFNVTSHIQLRITSGLGLLVPSGGGCPVVIHLSLTNQHSLVNMLVFCGKRKGHKYFSIIAYDLLSMLCMEIFFHCKQVKTIK